MQKDRVNKWMFCYSDNVEKELKYKHYIFISATGSHAPVQKNSVVLKKQATKVWRHLGHNLDGAIAKCLLCKYNPAKGDAHKSSLVNKYSFSQVQPWSSRFAKAPPKPWETTCRHITRRSSRTWWRRSRRSSRPPTNCKTKSFQLLPDELSTVDQL